MILDVDYQQRGLTMYVGKVSLFVLKFSLFVASQSWGSLIFLLASHLSLSLAINNWLGRLDLAQCKSACFINKEYSFCQNVVTYASSANSSLIDCLGIFICSFIIREKKRKNWKGEEKSLASTCAGASRSLAGSVPHILQIRISCFPSPSNQWNDYADWKSSSIVQCSLGVSVGLWVCAWKPKDYLGYHSSRTIHFDFLRQSPSCLELRVPRDPPPSVSTVL